MRLLAHHPVIRSAAVSVLGVSTLVAVVLLLGACGPATSASSASPASSKSVSASAAPSDAAPSGDTVPDTSTTTAPANGTSRTAPGSPSRATTADGTTLMHVFSIDVSARSASAQPVAIAECKGTEGDCVADHRVVTRGPKTTLRIAANATYVVAVNGTIGVCDDNDIRSGRCDRTAAQFAAAVRQSRTLVSVGVKGGVVVSMKEFFTP